MVALVIGMAILAILIAAVGPSIGTIMKREREEELIFRGKQIARSIGFFQRRYGRYPNTLKEMYTSKPRTIRHLWKEPMCDCDGWHLLIQGMPDSQPMGGGGVGLTPPGMPQFGGGATTPGPGVPGGGGPPAPPGGFSPTPTPGGLFGNNANPQQPVGPIVGVRSNVHKEALREWRGQKYYDEWRFIVGDADRDTTLPGTLPQGAPPGPTPFGRR
jgi:type II secretory pathway pseudopilin PulG